MLTRFDLADELSDMFTWWLFDDIRDFYEMYDEFCQSPSGCPLAIQVIVYCALCWLMAGNPITQRAGLDTSKYSGYTPVLERHLEVCISSYNLFVEPTDLNIAALSTAGTYAIYAADVNAAWILTSTAARLCQSMGYHRLMPPKSGGTEVYEKRVILFWGVYFVDKSLSLRLGRASSLQDYDFSTSWRDIVKIWQSPGNAKAKAGHRLAKMTEWLELSLEMATIQCFTESGWLYEYTDYYKECGDVILYSLLTLVYRAMPEISNTQQWSLQAARSTMQVHHSCARKAEAMGSGIKVESVMLCPFTPFIVLFRNVVTELNLDDLKLLEDFVASIEWLNDSNQRESLQRFHQLCHAFYNLAKHFVAARLRADYEHQAMTSAGQTLVMSTMQQPPTFEESLEDMTIPEDFQTWMDTHMDFMNNDWLAFGTL
ncbi:hypothetical protein E4T38_01467 [Aureobasidium subglaciale]|nr:hypothetical protein E4T38_01467 [Aureobasidium subglaciale]KAI5229647.1 hypothetical protein E4T40_01468 [Aureobasidium subglaciale]KAI5233363.1 hypothetical protein E4T41_01465 [Aureobasidium subglaciale]KAI5266677.1 hypothetical protein E4T46_01467 [Aureobasidium subglaciale]